MNTYRWLTLPAAVLITVLEVLIFAAVSTTAPAETPTSGRTAHTALAAQRDTTDTGVAP